MGTYRKDIRLGTKDPLWSTDDIADKAITEDKLADKTVGYEKLTDELKQMLSENDSPELGASLIPTYQTGFEIARDTSGVVLYVPFASSSQDGILSKTLYNAISNAVNKIEIQRANKSIVLDTKTIGNGRDLVVLEEATSAKAGIMTASHVAKLNELEQRILALEENSAGGGNTEEGENSDVEGGESGLHWYVGQVNATKDEFDNMSAAELVSACERPRPMETARQELAINKNIWFMMLPEEVEPISAGYTLNGQSTTFTKDTILNTTYFKLSRTVTIDGTTYRVYGQGNAELVNSNASAFVEIRN